MTLLFLALIVSQKSYCQEVIGVTEELPGLVEVDGEIITGPVTEKIQQILKKAKIKENIQIYPWARSYELAKRNKNYFIFPIAKNAEREKLFLYSEEKLYWISTCLLFARTKLSKILLH